MRTIDLETWERTTHYKFFKRMDYPQYNVCVDLDITHFLNVVKEKQMPFYYAMIFAATNAINEVEAFRYRIREDEVVFHDTLHPSFTDMSEGSDLFKMVTVNLDTSINDFVVIAKEKSVNQKDPFVYKDVEGRDDLIYITCLPWVSFTSLSHTISFNRNDSVPRIAWGKYYVVGDKILLPFSVQAHHSFVDGIHIGKYIDSLQNYLDTFI